VIHAVAGGQHMSVPVKTTAIVLVTWLFVGCAYAMPKGKTVGKQVRLPHHRLGIIVGRAEEGFIIMPLKPTKFQAAFREQTRTPR